MRFLIVNDDGINATGLLPLIRWCMKLGEVNDDWTLESLGGTLFNIKNVVRGNFYIKIPITREGLRATAICKDKGIGVTMTAIFTQQQALIAAVAGADYVAPYVNRLDNIVSDGVNVVSEIIDIFNSYKLPTKVLAASFKNAEQVHKCASYGCHSVTVSDDVLKMLIAHPMTDAAIANAKSLLGE